MIPCLAPATTSVCESLSASLKAEHLCVHLSEEKRIYIAAPRGCTPLREQGNGYLKPWLLFQQKADKKGGGTSSIERPLQRSILCSQTLPLPRLNDLNHHEGCKRVSPWRLTPTPSPDPESCLPHWPVMQLLTQSQSSQAGNNKTINGCHQKQSTSMKGFGGVKTRSSTCYGGLTTAYDLSRSQQGRSERALRVQPDTGQTTSRSSNHRPGND